MAELDLVGTIGEDDDVDLASESSESEDEVKILKVVYIVHAYAKLC